MLLGIVINITWCMTFYYNVFGVTDMCIVSAVSVWEEDYNLLLLALSCEY